MNKFEKVKLISEIVTYEGKIELTQGQVTDVLSNLAPKVNLAATQTEKSTMFLHENIKRLGLDLQSIAKTAENIQDTF
jgi:hypothetical protein